MLRIIKAVVDEEGNVKLLEPVRLPSAQKALVILLDIPETALLSEPALAEDWSRPEEDEAWSHLQQVS